jgi:hypothetical protein
MLIDVTRRSVFLSEENKERANREISAHLLEVADTLDNALPNTNIYIAGSLAAGEPSFDITNMRMRSDVDMILFTNS